MRQFKKVAKSVMANPSCSRLSFWTFWHAKTWLIFFHLAKRKYSALANLAKDFFSLALTQIHLEHINFNNQEN